MNLLNETCGRIDDVNQSICEQARSRIDQLIKPIGSLGRIEELFIQLAGITRNLFPEMNKKAVVVMAADHGVVQEGVTAYPSTVTAIQTQLFSKGVTGVCAFAKQTGAEVVPVDIGVAADINVEGVRQHKVKYGTNNFTKGPAMTREEAIQSLEVGIEISNELAEKGVHVIATGEMGIGNTTASAAITSVVTGADPYEVTGLGANYPVEKLLHKAAIVSKAIEVNQPDRSDGVDILAKVGGLEIGGMAGVMIGCAANRIPVVVDGFISSAAALIATTIEPNVKQYLIPSHLSKEAGAKKALEHLGLKPMFDLDLRLGEGSGAVLAFPLIEAATAMNREMITFEEAGLKV
ncbi:nicotinate-nucleotide--dimethylbenzimidazole phosphoribosyltransferase [Bacillus tianshenii]|nr:nicotinate-nucleotide--dimethylbenzimidazole phosphoribosyltransferase [Bacillus tianshenii]